MLEALSAQKPDADWSAQTSLFINAGFSEDLRELDLKAPDSRPARRRVDPDNAAAIWRYLEQDVYRNFPDYHSARRGLTVESPIQLDFQDTPAPSFTEATGLYVVAYRNWMALDLQQRKRLLRAVDYYRVTFTDDGPIGVVVNEYFVSVALPRSRHEELTDVLRDRARPAAEGIPVLEGDVWAATGLRPAPAPGLNDLDYRDALLTLSSDDKALRALREKFAGRLVHLVVAPGAREDAAADLDDPPAPNGAPTLTARGAVVVARDRLDTLAADLEKFSAAPPPYSHAVSPDQLLGLAIRQGWQHQFTTALERGADIFADCFAGMPALHAAAERGRTAMAMALIAAGVPVDLRDPNQRTPLHAALQRRRTGTAEALLLAGARPNLQTNARETALDIARRRSAPG